MKPQRIQLSRAKGWRLPPETVVVARPGKWGNPFRIGDTAERWGEPNIFESLRIVDAATAVALHREWLELHLAQHPEIMLPALDELRGKNLACWCSLGAPCHADTLLELANTGAEVKP